ncbi:unnamed protein product [Didymodactylos carnosus]|uniref:G-protein coupled receptors family 1 profile domain-containing protein n=1 Tax=Didymodactylos carnosus TaxID=1234261 RepID=A0A814IEW0_9BILA|nr:unnamed protein product [Didymodactylos carnosus]CAF3792167.1 unnamed protein product [Didymodactylos carnosus]
MVDYLWTKHRNCKTNVSRQNAVSRGSVRFILRANPCAIYFLSSAIIDFLIINIFLLLGVLNAWDNKITLSTGRNLLWCKMSNYLLLVLPILSSTYIILATIDRYCISSLNHKIRQLSRARTSRIAVTVTFIVWAIFSLHIPLTYDIISRTPEEPKSCTVSYNQQTFIIIVIACSHIM